MSWDTREVEKPGTSLMAQIQFVKHYQELIEDAEKYLDEEFGNIGSELPFPERIKLIIGRLQEEIEDLYHANARGEYDEEWLDRSRH